MTYGTWRACKCGGMWDGEEGKHSRRYGGVAPCGCPGMKNCVDEVIEVRCSCVTCTCGARLAGTATPEERDDFEAAHLFCPARAA